VDWIHLTQDRDQWRVLVNTVMNILIQEKVGNILTNWVYYQLLKKDSAPWSWLVFYILFR
jgi:hypothetical protein